MSRRCYLVHALAPPGTSARQANELLNEYAADSRRGIPVWHDHFVGTHGGVVVLDVTSDSERELLEDAGPLAGWSIATYPLTFSLTGAGFAAQLDFTLDRYGGTTLEGLAAEEGDDPRFWWRDG